MNPHIEVMQRSINNSLNYNDPNFDDSAGALFHVFISENLLKVLFTVIWRDPAHFQREFQVVRHDHLFLDGHDLNATYPVEATAYTGVISADPSIMQELFQQALNPYGIRLDKITVHNQSFFESVNFTFEDPIKLDELYDRINQACIKAKYSPASLA